MKKITIKNTPSSNIKNLALLFLCMGLSCFSCQNKQASTSSEENIKFQNTGHELIFNMVQKVGDYEMLKTKNDVVYTYTYTTPYGKKDVSIEKYLFEGELSYGKYTQHERTLSGLEGVIEQGYDGNEYWLKHNGEILNDSSALKRVTFNRPTNFYWFAMFQKLLDPGLNYEYLNDTTIDHKKYDIVKVSFEPKNNKPTDIYQVYINKKTGVVDQFLFTVADFGMIETPLLMKVEYEKVDDLLIPSKRKYKKSTWEASVLETPWIEVNWTNISFNNGLKKDDFRK